MRHNLSLNQAFRKVERSDGWQGKKGYFWEVNRDRQAQLDREMEKFLREEGRELVQNQPSTSSECVPAPAELVCSAVPVSARESDDISFDLSIGIVLVIINNIINIELSLIQLWVLSSVSV